MDGDAYLSFERESPDKHELWDGEVFAMGGASLAHNRIVRNLVRHLGNALEGTDCEVLPSDMRVRIPGSERYVYPDVTVVCGPAELEGQADVLLNPSVIIEVLSSSTAAFDRGEKFAGYRSIPSVQEIVFLSQDVARAEHYARQSDDSWVLREIRDDGAVALRSVSEPLALGRIYDGVTMPGEADGSSSG